MNDNDLNANEPKAKKPRGFAAMSRERNREISAMGGKKAQETGKARRWTPEEAREAGRKGGKSCAARHDMRTRGQRGGEAAALASAHRESRATE